MAQSIVVSISYGVWVGGRLLHGRMLRSGGGLSLCCLVQQVAIDGTDAGEGEGEGDLGWAQCCYVVNGMDWIIGMD